MKSMTLFLICYAIGKTVIKKIVTLMKRGYKVIRENK